MNYRSWIRKQALKKNLHGYAKNLENGKVVVMVASDEEEKIKKTCKQGSSRAKDNNITELEYNSIVKLGFEIR